MCNHDLRLRKWLCCTSFTTIGNFFVNNHSLIIHDFGLLINPRNLIVILLLLKLTLVVSIGTWPFVINLDVSCVIIAFWKSINHFLNIIDLCLPLTDVCVHVLNESARRRGFEFVFWNIFPDVINLFQVWKQPSDLEINFGEFLWGYIIISDVSSNSFLCDIFVVVITLLDEECGTTNRRSVYLRHSLILNNNKLYLLH